MGQVDRCLDEIEVTILFYESKDSAKRPSKLLTESDIRARRFKTGRMREGYDMGEVDAFLEKLQASVAWHEINS